MVGDWVGSGSFFEVVTGAVSVFLAEFVVGP